MAIEATQFNLFPKQLLQDRDTAVNLCNQVTMVSSHSHGHGHNGQQILFPANPFPGFQPLYQPVVCDSIQQQAKTESGLTYNIPAPRKRSRDNQISYNNIPAPQKNNSVSQFPSFLGESILPQIQQHQLEIDAIICQHTKKIRVELEDRQKQQAKLLMSAIGDGVMNKLKEKDEQILRMGKLNMALQERVKSLYVENQLWRDLAQANEATANSLRSNLEQVLAQVGGDEHISAGVCGGAAVEEEDVESCCGSSDHGKEVDGGDTLPYEVGNGNSCYSDRTCRRCGERESCVLLLPCRHLCLCSACGSGSQQLKECPVCHSSMTATLHVNVSS